MKMKTNSPRLFRDDIGAYSTESLGYREWIEAANKFKDQNFIWRQHELYARANKRREHATWIDLGGEA